MVSAIDALATCAFSIFFTRANWQALEHLTVTEDAAFELFERSTAVSARCFHFLYRLQSKQRFGWSNILWICIFYMVHRMARRRLSIVKCQLEQVHPHKVCLCVSARSSITIQRHERQF